MIQNDMKEWINVNNDIQCRWALKYLEKKGFRHNPDRQSRSQFFADLAYQVNPEFIRKMKGAWRTYKHTHKAEYSARSFVLPNKVWRSLATLAGNKSMTQALQEIIEQLSTGEKWESDKLKQQKKRVSDPDYQNAIRRVRQVQSSELAELIKFKDQVLSAVSKLDHKSLENQSITEKVRATRREANPVEKEQVPATARETEAEPSAVDSAPAESAEESTLLETESKANGGTSSPPDDETRPHLNDREHLSEEEKQQGESKNSEEALDNTTLQPQPRDKADEKLKRKMNIYSKIERGF